MGSKSSKLSGADLQHLQRMKNCSHSEIRRDYNKFLAQYPRGKASRAQFMRAALDDGVPPDAAEKLFATLDTDKSGYVDFNEFFMGCIMKESRQDMHVDPETAEEQFMLRKLNILFNWYDLNGNGYVERGEMVQLLKGIVAMQRRQQQADGDEVDARDAVTTAHEVFSQMDAGGEGRVSRKRFIAQCRQNPTLHELLLVHT